MIQHADFSCDGLAALGICELLLYALTDRNIISEHDVRDLLTDVVTTHNEAAIVSANARVAPCGRCNGSAHAGW